MNKMTQREYDMLIGALRTNEQALEDARAGKRLTQWVERLESRVTALRARATEAIIVDEASLDRRKVEVIPVKLGL